MHTDHGRVLLVGSVARPHDGWNTEDVLRNCAGTLGAHVSMLPDGEVGPRHLWIIYLARWTYLPHPDLELIHPSRETLRDDPDWTPRSYDDQYLFRVRDGVTHVELGELGYARAALASYAIFRTLRAEGAIPRGTRFMVALPMIESGVRRFFDRPRDFEIMWSAYATALQRELRTITDAIPADDLAVQWDMVAETYAVEGVQMRFDSDQLSTLPVNGLERYELALATLARHVPDRAWVGLHICYGSLGQRDGHSSDDGHEHAVTDLRAAVRMANAAAGLDRQPTFAHMPVPLSAGFDAAYYAPLADLTDADLRLYLGLVHLHDGVAGALERVRVARRHRDRFGIATQCGWGRRPPGQRIEDILELERAIADGVYGRPAAGPEDAGRDRGRSRPSHPSGR